MSKTCTSVDTEKEIDIFYVLANALLYPLTDFTAGRLRRDGVVEPAVTHRRRGLFGRLEHWLATLRRRDVESYLANATDVCDLEARMRALQRSNSYLG